MKATLVRLCRDREEGQALVLMAFAMVVVVAATAMSVDVGRAYWAKTQLQAAVDAAALAGAQDLPNTALAGAKADLYWDLNDDRIQAAGNSAGITKSYTIGTSTNTITVAGTAEIDTWFAQVLGLDSWDITATATARAVSLPITGYSWSSVAPFVIWGGTREDEVHAGDQHCPLHTCVGRSYTFLDTGWMDESGTPTTPDWTANDSNNFKGDIDHGNGADVSDIGEFVSVGGLGSVTAPAVGSIIVIPIVDRASGNSNSRTFRIAAWAILKVDSGCTKQHCTGTLQSPASITEPPTGWSTGGSSLPPGSITYTTKSFGLSQ